MEITLTKLSDKEHAVHIKRSDGTEDSLVLDSRSFLRHDLAHLAVESEIPLALGYWGCVASGAALNSKEIHGQDIVIAESLSGPVQVLMRTNAGDDMFFSTLSRIRPQLITKQLAARIREQGRKLQGHWKATSYGEDMQLQWNENLVSSRQK